VYLANFKETKYKQTQTKRKTSAKEKYEPSPGGFHQSASFHVLEPLTDMSRIER